jgi:preprotein translocase subunit SecD
MTAANLQVHPGRNVNGMGFSSNTVLPPDPKFATYPSTTPSNDLQDQDVLLPGTPSGGAARYVLGPVGLNRDAIASARATEVLGLWVVDLGLTPTGATQWDSMAQQTFHAMTAVVISGQVVSAPITQPSRTSFTSFDGQLEFGQGFSEQQAKAIAAEL